MGSTRTGQEQAVAVHVETPNDAAAAISVQQLMRIDELMLVGHATASATAICTEPEESSVHPPMHQLIVGLKKYGAFIEL